ncbi:TPA_asm: hypothetical protein [Hydra MELD virus]|nr:TPA_asm: hypothetical protein [Hydra MELD virus]
MESHPNQVRIANQTNLKMENLVFQTNDFDLEADNAIPNVVLPKDEETFNYLPNNFDLVGENSIAKDEETIEYFKQFMQTAEENDVLQNLKSEQLTFRNCWEDFDVQCSNYEKGKKKEEKRKAKEYAKANINSKRRQGRDKLLVRLHLHTTLE